MMKTCAYSKIIFFLIGIALCANAYGINPQKNYVIKPDAIGIPYETYKIKVSDSVMLNSWVCLQKDRHKPFVIISGPDAGNMGNALGQAKAFYENGYNVILYDYRGFGESTDFKIDPNRMYYDEFSEDLNKTIEFVNTKFQPISIVLYGMSMGTIVSRMNADSNKAIKGLILDSFVTDPQLVVKRIFSLKKKEVLLPENASRYAQSNTRNVNKPVLIFSGLKDVVTKTDDYITFLAKNPAAKMVTWDCNHLECFTSMGEEPNLYVEAVNEFIGKL